MREKEKIISDANFIQFQFKIYLLADIQHISFNFEEASNEKKTVNTLRIRTSTALQATVHYIKIEQQIQLVFFQNHGQI